MALVWGGLGFGISDRLPGGAALPVHGSHFEKQGSKGWKGDYRPLQVEETKRTHTKYRTGVASQMELTLHPAGEERPTVV